MNIYQYNIKSWSNIWLFQLFFVYLQRKIKKLTIKRIMVRSTITTQGKAVSFSVDSHYYLPLPNADKSTIFDGYFKDSKFCVAYTKVVHDCGYHDVMRWGTPNWEYYDNGNVGYQCFNYFNSKDEALNDYDARKKLTRKDFTNTIAYADVFLIENNN